MDTRGRQHRAHTEDQGALRGRIRIKAAGGIRTLEEFMKLAEMGVERMGVNMQSAVEIVQALAER